MQAVAPVAVVVVVVVVVLAAAVVLPLALPVASAAPQFPCLLPHLFLWSRQATTKSIEQGPFLAPVSLPYASGVYVSIVMKGVL